MRNFLTEIAPNLPVNFIPVLKPAVLRKIAIGLTAEKYKDGYKPANIVVNKTIHKTTINSWKIQQ